MYVNYLEADKNCMRSDVERAVQFFIQGKQGCIMSIFPQALNPFLRSLESMGAWKKALVIPYSDSRNKPIYIVLKIDGDLGISQIQMGGDPK